MGGAKVQLEEYYAWLEEQAEREIAEARALVDEARSRARLSCACKDMRRGLSYPLTVRIVELAAGARAFGLADD